MTKLLTVALGATLCAAMAFGGDYFPLAQGNSWTYRDAKTGQTFTVRVGTPVAFQSGKVYYPLSGYVQQQVLARVENDQLFYLDEELQREILLTSFQSDGVTWWNAPFRECPAQGQAQTKRAPHNGPAGNWDSALEIRYRSTTCADAGLENEQFAENIGMLRRVSQTIAGPRAFDLVHARVGSQLIEVGEYGRFSVSALPNPARRVWQVTVSLDLNGPGLRVVFPSSQEFDAVVRDSRGNTIYSWSADKSFLQAIREVTLESGWSETFEVPYPVGSAVLAGPFTLEAWLTTAPEPKFAASTSLEIPR